MCFGRPNLDHPWAGLTTSPEPYASAACLLNQASSPENAPGAAMKIVINDQVHLSEFRSSDKPALIQHLNDRDIYDRTLRIPFPYTEADAEAFLARVAKATEQHCQPAHFAIRNAEDHLIGTCGFN